MPDRPFPVASSPTDRPTHVVFVAAIPPQEIVDQIADAWHLTGTGGTLHPRLHLSILAIAGLRAPLDPILIDRVSKSAANLRTGPFELSFDRLLTFGTGTGNRPLVFATDSRSDRPTALARDLQDCLNANGLALPRPRKVIPHITVNYGAPFPETRPLPKPIRWTIRNVSLIDSIQGQSRHVVLGTWPLRDDEPSLF